MKESRYRKINIKNKFVENKRIIFVIVIILLTICIDQIVKIYMIKNIYNSSIIVVNGFLNFTYVENTGGAFGIGTNSTIMFIVVSVIVISLLVKIILSRRNEINIIVLLAISLIIAGGMGNLIDRILRGCVIDYIDINPLIRYPVFNIADICVVLGGIIVIINLIINTRRK